MSWVVLKFELELKIPMQASTPPLVQMPLPSTQHPVIFFSENLSVKKVASVYGMSGNFPTKTWNT
jgi:hypothetical protein